MEAIKLNDYVYSKFGYGVVIEKVSPLEADNTRLKQDDTSPKNTETILPEEFAKVKYNWGGLGYLQAKDLKKSIDVSVKTFKNDRKEYSLTIPITSTILHLFTELKKQLEKEGADSLANPKFYYPMGTVQKLDSETKTMHQYSIPDGAKLLLFAKVSLRWNVDNKAGNLEFSNTNTTVSIVQPTKESTAVGSVVTVLGNIPMKSGKHFWTIRFDKIDPNEESLSVGVCYGDINTSEIPMNTGVYWGYQPLVRTRFSPETSAECGESYKQGDSISVSLEFVNECGTLTFYKNGHCIDVSMGNLVGTFYAAISFFSVGSQVTIINSANP